MMQRLRYGSAPAAAPAPATAAVPAAVEVARGLEGMEVITHEIEIEIEIGVKNSVGVMDVEA
jgi:hypothetical protein